MLKAIGSQRPPLLLLRVTFHEHRDENGLVVACYHVCKSQLKSGRFWFGLTVVNTLEFLPEHFIWFKLWPFTAISKALGMS